MFRFGFVFKVVVVIFVLLWLTDFGEQLMNDVLAYYSWMRP